MPNSTEYIPDYRLRDAYEEASRLDERAIEALCPSYLEVAAPGPRYEQAELLGRGATKEVFRAWDSRMRRWIALARLKPDCGPETYDAFIHEAWLTSSLSHPNIIGIHDLGVDDQGRPFFTMDLKGGRSLAEAGREFGRLPLSDALVILTKVCDAVACAHAQRALHLDLKPDNIQVSDFGEVLVCDWGLGTVLGDDDGAPLAGEHDSHSLSGEVRGTPGYMAPEQATPGGTVDERADVFALGCLLHFVLTGAPPVPPGSRREQLARTREARFASPRECLAGARMPAALEAVFVGATARDPADRYPSAAAFGEDLRRFLAGYATTAEQAGFFREAGLFLRRNRAAAAAALLGLVALTVLSVLFVQRLDRQREITRKERAKSTALAGDVTRLKDMYAAQSEEFRQSARELARSFARSADTLKNIGIFTDPLKSLDEASQLAALALTLDPDCDAARLQQFDVRCHLLDFRSALALPPLAEGNPYADYFQIAAVARDFQFGRDHRPRPDELAAFLRAAASANPHRAPLMERIVAYDSAARRDHRGYGQVVAALLAYVNPGWSEDQFRPMPAADSLVLRSTTGLRLAVPPGGGSGTCLLRFFPLRSLTLAVEGPVELDHLDGLVVETLDLRGCPEARLGVPVRLPLLATLHVRQGQFPRPRLDQWARSVAPVRIVEHP